MSCNHCIYYTTVRGWENSGNKLEVLTIERGSPEGFNNNMNYKKISLLGGHVCTYYKIIFNTLKTNCSAEDLG